jgi:hypothetical protein
MRVLCVKLETITGGTPVPLADAAVGINLEALHLKRLLDSRSSAILITIIASKELHPGCKDELQHD